MVDVSFSTPVTPSTRFVPDTTVLGTLQTGSPSSPRLYFPRPYERTHDVGSPLPDYQMFGGGSAPRTVRPSVFLLPCDVVTPHLSVTPGTLVDTQWPLGSLPRPVVSLRSLGSRSGVYPGTILRLPERPKGPFGHLDETHHVCVSSL